MPSSENKIINKIKNIKCKAFKFNNPIIISVLCSIILFMLFLLLFYGHKEYNFPSEINILLGTISITYIVGTLIFINNVSKISEKYKSSALDDLMSDKRINIRISIYLFSFFALASLILLTVQKQNQISSLALFINIIILIIFIPAFIWSILVLMDMFKLETSTPLMEWLNKLYDGNELDKDKILEAMYKVLLYEIKNENTDLLTKELIPFIYKINSTYDYTDKFYLYTNINNDFIDANTNLGNQTILTIHYHAIWFLLINEIKEDKFTNSNSTFAILKNIITNYLDKDSKIKNIINILLLQFTIFTDKNLYETYLSLEKKTKDTLCSIITNNLYDIVTECKNFSWDLLWDFIESHKIKCEIISEILNMLAHTLYKKKKFNCLKSYINDTTIKISKKNDIDNESNTTNQTSKIIKIMFLIHHIKINVEYPDKIPIDNTDYSILEDIKNDQELIAAMEFNNKDIEKAKTYIDNHIQ